MTLKFKLLALAAVLAGAQQLPVLAQDSLQKSPEAGTGYHEKTGWAARKYMVAGAQQRGGGAGAQMV
jgi:gamma-glutamyltranspeptidase/glutathione hydrolase